MNKSKPLLAIETSQNICGASVYFSDEAHYEVTLHNRNVHAEKIFEIVDAVLKLSSCSLEQMEGIAVSAGPGSFTGLRIGMSAAKGLAFGAGLPIAPVPTFEALALELLNYLKKDNTEFIIANKVNAEEVYFSKFQIITNNYIFAEELQILNIEEFKKKKEGKIFFGNADSQKQENVLAAPSPLYVAKWCRIFGNDLFNFDYDYIEPNYLKNFIIKDKSNA